MSVPRLRVFAGPNGSGKSTIKGDLDPNLIKTYVNADELELEARTTGFVDLAIFGLEINLPELQNFHAQHYLLSRKGLTAQAARLALSRR